MHVLISAVSSARKPSGICRHAANLATLLSSAPNISQVTLLVGEWQLFYFRDAFGLRDGTLRIIPVGVANRPLDRNWWYFFQLPEIARKYGADLLHLSFPAPIRRSGLNTPVVLSLHDLYPYDACRNFGYHRVLFNRAFLQQCLGSSDAVVCSSDFTLRRLRQLAPGIASRKAIRIYQQVALNPANETAPALEELRTQPFLLSVAQHRSNKNLDLLLLAFAAIRHLSRSSKLRLVIVGAEGPETSKLHALTRQLRLEDHVSFLSNLTDFELCWLYRRCELMVAPSSVEGFCIPVIEALGCGSRVLCSDIPVLREIGGSSCHYVSLKGKQPVSALTQAMEETLRHPTPKPQSSNRFSAREISRQYYDLYSALLSNGNIGALSPQFPSVEAAHYDRYAS
jgi:glycosyltransferase involved in cell wall biosynthesis